MIAASWGEDRKVRETQAKACLGSGGSVTVTGITGAVGVGAVGG